MQTLLRLPRQACDNLERPLEVVVLFTTMAETASALEAASTLAHGLSARVRLLAPQVVPYPLQLNEPAVRPSHVASRLLALAHDAGVDASIEIRLCRETSDALRQSLPAHSIVVLGTRGHWWKPGSGRLGQLLRKQGHHVVLSCLK